MQIPTLHYPTWEHTYGLLKDPVRLIIYIQLHQRESLQQVMMPLLLILTNKQC